MSFETIKNTIKDYIETKKELNSSRDLINKSEGCVSMMVYDNSSSDQQGKAFGPRGYDENEMDAIKRELKNGDRIVISGERDTVIIINRNKK